MSAKHRSCSPFRDATNAAAVGNAEVSGPLTFLALASKHTILNHDVAEHPRSWDQLLGALTLAYNSRPHRSTGVAPLELVNPMGVSSRAFKNIPMSGAYPIVVLITLVQLPVY